MKKTIILLSALLGCSGLFAQDEIETESKPRSHSPFTLYMSPILDGASIAASWSFNNSIALDIYGFKRKSDNSTYYSTKVNENLAELTLKIYAPNTATKRFRPFFGPSIGFRNIKYDEADFFSGRGFGTIDDPFGFGGPLRTDLRANSKYLVPLYFGFDFRSKRGLVFEYAAGFSFQKSWGETDIQGPVIKPYAEGYNIRSRFLFGYEF